MAEKGCSYWRGKPLSNYETIIKLIGSTKTKRGLEIEARIDERDYEMGIKILDEDMAQLKISLDELFGVRPLERYISDCCAGKASRRPLLRSPGKFSA